MKEQIDNQAENSAKIESEQENTNNVSKYSELTKEDKDRLHITDERDYEEYLAEKEARIKEREKFDKKLFEDIKSIDNIDDRNLATAILPYYYNNALDRTIPRENTVVQERINAVKRDMMNTIVETISNGNSASLRDVIAEKSQKIYEKIHDDDNYYVPFRYAEAIISNGIVDNHPSDLDILRKGQEIEQMKLSEARVENDDPYTFFTFEYDSFYNNGNKETNKEIFPCSAWNEDACTILVTANDIVKRIKEETNPTIRRSDSFKIGSLQWSFSSDRRLPRVWQNLEDKRTKAIDGIIESGKAAINGGGFDDKISDSIDERDLTSLIWLSDLEGELRRNNEARELYNYSLELGKEILNGEDWHEIDPVMIHIQSLDKARNFMK